MVLVIIGLLLGAVLKGQELIASTRVNKLIKDMNGYKAALYAFQDRYRMVPGDSSTAAMTVGNGAVNCTLYCDNRKINYVWNTNLVNNHLLAAGFYSGPAGNVENDNGPYPGAFLNNPGGGSIFVAHAGYYYYDSSAGAYPHNARAELQTGGRLSSKLLAEVDRRIDDGNSKRGFFLVSTEPWQTQGYNGCTEVAMGQNNGVWLENNPGTNCGAVEMLEM